MGARPTTGTRVLARLRRVPRRRLLLGVLVLAVLSALVIVALGARPAGDASFPVGVEAAHEGTTYAFDGVICLESQVTAATVGDVEVEQAPGTTTRLVGPVDGPPTLGLPADPAAAPSPKGYTVAAGAQDCGLRLLVTADRQGDLRAGTIRLQLRYGPAGLLRRTLTLEPAVMLQVTRTGPDRRAAGS